MRRTLYERPDTILRGQMWWADIPQDKCNPHAQYGLRPVVIISNDKGNAHSPSLLVCPLTTQEDKYKFIHPNVMCNHTLSYVQCEQIKVLDKELLGQYIGKVRDVEQDYIDRAIAVATSLAHYLEQVNELKQELATTNKALEEANKEVNVLNERIAQLEAENAKYKMNEDAMNLGMHVKGIVDILSKDIKLPIAEPILEEVQNIISDSDKTPSQPDDQAIKPVNTKPSSNLSAIEKFNRRLEKHHQIVKPSAPTDYKYTQSVDKLGRPSARKWDDATIRKFVKDYNELSEDELLRKYDLRSYSTAYKYYKKFMKHESL